MAGTITIVGLGSGNENQLTIGAWRALKSAPRVFLRTERHPAAEWLRAEGIRFESFDSIYERHSSFGDVYEAIAGRLLDEGRKGDIVYAVPGHPMVAEETVRRLLAVRSGNEEADGKDGRETSGNRDVPDVVLIGGVSFLDEAFARLGFDPIEGFQLLDAETISPQAIRPRLHTVIGQVYDRRTASDVKLALMEIYPDDYPVVVAHDLGIAGAERIRRLPLYELDRTDDFGDRSLVWVPRSDDERLTYRFFERLHETVRILRSPEGCPWDREQTHKSLRKHLIEEAYEVLEAIDDDDPDAMREELGDLLLQVMLHAQMEEETGTFNVWDVVAGLNEKLIRRHPHVFGEVKAANADEALKTWQAMKAEEKRSKTADGKAEENGAASLLDGVPRGLPALLAAYKLQKKAAEAGFDWNRIADVLDKVEEEINEIKQLAAANGQAAAAAEREALEEELGDLLFAAVNAARFLNIDPESALAAANRKFIRRFRHIERRLRESGRTFAETDLQEMEAWWQEAKAGERV